MFLISVAIILVKLGLYYFKRLDLQLLINPCTYFYIYTNFSYLHLSSKIISYSLFCRSSEFTLLDTFLYLKLLIYFYLLNLLDLILLYPYILQLLFIIRMLKQSCLYNYTLFIIFACVNVVCLKNFFISLMMYLNHVKDSTV